MVIEHLAEVKEKESAQIEAYKKSWPKNVRVLNVYFATALLPIVFVCFITVLSSRIYLDKLVHKLALSSENNLLTKLAEHKLYIVCAVPLLVGGALAIFTTLIITKKRPGFLKYSFSKFMFYIIVDIVLFTILIFVSIASVAYFR